MSSADEALPDATNGLSPNVKLQCFERSLKGDAVTETRSNLMEFLDKKPLKDIGKNPTKRTSKITTDETVKASGASQQTGNIRICSFSLTCEPTEKSADTCVARRRTSR